VTDVDENTTKVTVNPAAITGASRRVGRTNRPAHKRTQLEKANAKKHALAAA
jgi:hypothetical protein